MKNGNRFVSPSSLRHRSRNRCTTLQINGRHVNHFGHSKIEISDALVSGLHTHSSSRSTPNHLLCENEFY